MSKEMKLIMEKFNAFAKEEASKTLFEEVDLKDHAKKVDFEKKVLPMLNSKLKELKAIDKFELQIEVTAATGDVEKALEAIRKSLDNAIIAQKLPLETQLTFLAEYIKTGQHTMTGSQAFTKAINRKYAQIKKEHSKPSNMDRVKAKARERAAAVQKAALGSERAPGVSQGTIRNNKVVPGSVKGKAQNP